MSDRDDNKAIRDYARRAGRDLAPNAAIPDELRAEYEGAAAKATPGGIVEPFTHETQVQQPSDPGA